MRGIPISFVLRSVRAIIALATVFALASCALFATHIGAPVLTVAARPDVATIQQVFVSSARVRLPDGSINPAAPSERASYPTYLTYDVSVPKIADGGEVIYARGDSADPAREYAITQWDKLDYRDNYIRAISQAVSAEPRNNRDVMIYVHGFNTPFANGLFRMAQIDRDFQMPATKVLFDWPNGGNPLLYIQDVDSQLASRDALTQTVQDTGRSDASGVVLVGYSSGAQIVMEALRQLKLSGDTRTLNRISGIILISPDMDVDVFKQTADRFGATLPQPFYIFASRKDDGVMKVLSPLWGDKQRLAHIEDFQRLSGYDITFVDPGASGDNGFMNHFAIAASPTFISLANDISGGSLLGFGATAQAGLVPGSSVSQTGQITAVVLPAN